MQSYGFIQTIRILEIISALAAVTLFMRSSMYKRFSAMTAYLCLRATTVVLLNLIGVLMLSAQPGSTKHALYQIYFYSYWLIYLVSAILIYFALQQIFRHLMAPLAGLKKLGMVAFRWVAVISVVITFATLDYTWKPLMLAAIANNLMRWVSVLELCMLGFIALTLNTLGLSHRSKLFGFPLGFGILAAADFICAAVGFRTHTIVSAANYIVIFAGIAALATWSIYARLAEPIRKPITLPVSSPLLRWNEIAMALGHQPPQVAVPASANTFFLTDVEKVVDKVLSRNSLSA